MVKLRRCCCPNCRGAGDKVLPTLPEEQIRQRQLGWRRRQQTGEVHAELLQELGLPVLGPGMDLPLQVLVLGLLLLVVVLLLLVEHAAED
jgi:hypothetical protein